MYRGIWVLCLLVMAAFLGCGNSGQELPTVQAGGTVTMNGNPVAGANVYFSPPANGRAAYGVTDGRGYFRLNTSPAIPGVMPGNYTVGISKPRAEAAPAPGKNERSKSPTPKLGNELPDCYREPAKSKLTAEVKTGEKNQFRFDLKAP